MKAWFEPILGKKTGSGAVAAAAKVTPVTPATPSKLEAVMRAALNDLWRVCATYEAPPGPSYRRTLTLKKSWSKVGPQTQGKDLVGEVRSSGNVAPYNRLVRGAKGEQAAKMAARGWKSIDEIAADVWPQYQAQAAQVLKGG